MGWKLKSNFGNFNKEWIEVVFIVERLIGKWKLFLLNRFLNGSI